MISAKSRRATITFALSSLLHVWLLFRSRVVLVLVVLLLLVALVFVVVVAHRGQSRFDLALQVVHNFVLVVFAAIRHRTVRARNWLEHVLITVRVILVLVRIGVRRLQPHRVARLRQRVRLGARLGFETTSIECLANRYDGLNFGRRLALNHLELLHKLVASNLVLFVAVQMAVCELLLDWLLVVRRLLQSRLRDRMQMSLVRVRATLVWRILQHGRRATHTRLGKRQMRNLADFRHEIVHLIRKGELAQVAHQVRRGY